MNCVPGDLVIHVESEYLFPHYVYSSPPEARVRPHMTYMPHNSIALVIARAWHADAVKYCEHEELLVLFQGKFGWTSIDRLEVVTCDWFPEI
jgi:hypothetical protein